MPLLLLRIEAPDTRRAKRDTRATARRTISRGCRHAAAYVALIRWRSARCAAPAKLRQTPRVVVTDRRTQRTRRLTVICAACCYKRYAQNDAAAL